MRQFRLSFYVFKEIFRSAGLEAFATVFCYLLQSVMPAVTTWAIQKIISSVYAGEDGAVYAKYIAIVALGYGLTYLMQTVYAITLNAGVFEKSNAYCRSRVSAKSAGLDLIQYEDFHVLNMQKLAMDCAQEEVLGMTFLLLFQSVCRAISVISVTWVLACYSPVAAFCALITTVPYFIVKLVRGNAMYHVHVKNTPKKRTLSYIYGLFCDKSSAKDIRMLNAGNYLSQKWENIQNTWKEEVYTESRKELVSVTFCECFTVFGMLTAIGFVLWNTLSGSMSSATFGACIYAFQSVSATGRQFFSQIGQIPQYMAMVNDYREFMLLSPANNDFKENKKQDSSKIRPFDDADRKEASGFEGTETDEFEIQEPHLNRGIELREVSFSYPGSKKVLFEHLDLYIPAGQSIALVGQNGSGKTTLSKLLTGTYPTEHGEVRWDDRSLKYWGKESIYRQVAVVPQPLNKFKLQLDESLCLGCETEADWEHMQRILQSVGLERLADRKYKDTLVGKEFGGIELSEGEWQKLAIARCIYKNASLVILDEPTSSLDPLSEQKVLDDFIRLSKGKTSVIITHRLGICRKVDWIIVLEQGKIVQEGTHEKLMIQHGLYQEMFEAQRGWYEG